MGTLAQVVPLAVVLAVSLWLPSPAGATSGRDRTTGAPAAGAPVSVVYLTQVDMASYSKGLGVADLARNGPNGSGRELVVSTSDGGASWAVVGAYAESRGSAFDEPRMDVAQNGDLYVVDTDHGAVWLSTDDAASWQRVTVAGELDTARLVGDALWVTADHCSSPVGRPATSTCTTYLSVYQLGTTTPLFDRPVPGATSRGVFAPTVLNQKSHEAAILGVDGREGAVLVEGDDVGATRLVATADAGLRWRTLSDPCARRMPGAGALYPQPVGLYVSPVGRWTLYCTRDLGMNQGLNVLYTSTDGGRGWRVLARSFAPGIRPVGTFDGTMAATFAMSNDGRCFWKVSTVGPESQSCDGGLRWQSPPRDPNTVLPSALDPVGPRGAFLVDMTQGLWRTVDGVHWILLR